jgi:hypothetical protein
MVVHIGEAGICSLHIDGKRLGVLPGVSAGEPHVATLGLGGGFVGLLDDVAVYAHVPGEGPPDDGESLWTPGFHSLVWL